jgi:hypothetical protein
MARWIYGSSRAYMKCPEFCLRETTIIIVVTNIIINQIESRGSELFLKTIEFIANKIHLSFQFETMLRNSK